MGNNNVKIIKRKQGHEKIHERKEKMLSLKIDSEVPYFNYRGVGHLVHPLNNMPEKQDHNLITFVS